MRGVGMREWPVLCAAMLLWVGRRGHTAQYQQQHFPAYSRPHHITLVLQRYPISGYIQLPMALQPFVQLPIMDHVIVVAKPSGDVSGGLEHYREVGGPAS